MRITKVLIAIGCFVLKAHSGFTQYITVPANDEILFQDNGQIRSLDNNHRILFRRSENTMEFREFGRFVFSPGATTGNETSKMVLADNGNLGIGTASPSAPLTVISNDALMSLFKHNGSGNVAITVANNTGQMNLGVGAATPHPYVWSNTGNFFIGNDGDPTIFVNGMGNGNVGIGTQDTKGHKLAVAGTALFTKVTVKAIPWADYVFHANYRLRPLSEVEQYIKQHHHLPEVPTAEEVEKNGIDVGDNQATLLKKIEELTLYVIDLEKRMKELETKNKK